MEPLLVISSHRQSNGFLNKELMLEINLKRKLIDKNSNYFSFIPSKGIFKRIYNEKNSSSGLESTCEKHQELHNNSNFSRRYLDEINAIYRNINNPINSNLESSIYKSPSSIPRITQMDFQLESKQLLTKKSQLRNYNNLRNTVIGRNDFLNKNNSSVLKKTSLFIPIKTTNNSYFSTKLFRKLSSGTLHTVFNKSEEIKSITQRLNNLKSKINNIESENRDMKIIFQPKPRNIKFDSFTEFLKLSNKFYVNSQKIIQQNHANKFLLQRYRIGNFKKS